MKSVYSAVRIGFLNKVVCASSVRVKCDLPLKNSFPPKRTSVTGSQQLRISDLPHGSALIEHSYMSVKEGTQFGFMISLIAG